MVSVITVRAEQFASCRDAASGPDIEAAASSGQACPCGQIAHCTELAGYGFMGACRVPSGVIKKVTRLSSSHFASSLATCPACQLVLPAGVLIPRACSALAISEMDVTRRAECPQ
jgi:hypothetical protein